MEKRISYDEFMSVKRVAQACNPLMVKRDRIKKQLDKLQTEFDCYDTQINALQAGIRQIIGFPVEQLVKKVIEPTLDDNGNPVLNKEGNPVKTTKYVPTDMVTYDKETKQYVITVEDEVPDNCPPVIDTAKEPDSPDSITTDTPEFE